LGAARALGIEAEFSGRNDILAMGRKFSGNAFYHGRNASFHHGTILVDVDMNVMQQYLNVPEQKLVSKGVESVKSRVINLREIVPDLSVVQVKEAMGHAFIEEYGGAGETSDPGVWTKSSDYAGLYEKYGSWEWRVGKSPKFDVAYETRFPWGGVEIGLMVDKGIVQEANIYSDAMEEDVIGHMAKSLTGVPFSRSSIDLALRRLAKDTRSGIVEDVADWIVQN